MDYLQEPDVKGKYEKSKFKVKYWEHEFKKTHGRLPSKLDIKEASNEIRYAYKTYFNLKSKALEQSFQGIDGFNSDDDAEVNISSMSSFACSSIDFTNDTASNTVDELKTEVDLNKVNTEKTWGTHLCNEKVEKEDGTIVKEKKSNINSSITQKLFRNSSFSKRNPRKSLSFVHHKSNNSISDSQISFSQPSISINLPTDSENLNKDCGNSMEDLMDCMITSSVKIVKPVEPILTKSLNVASVLDNDFKLSRNLDSGWMSRVAATTGTKIENRNLSESNFSLTSSIIPKPKCESDEDIIADSDEEEHNKLRLSKKRKVGGLNLCTFNNSVQSFESSQFSSGNLSQTFNNSTQCTEIFNNIDLNNENSLDTVKDHSSNAHHIENTKENVATIGEKFCEEKVKPKAIPKNHSQALRKSTRDRKTLINLSNQLDEDNDYESEDPSFDPSKEKPEEVYTFSDDSKTNEKSKSKKVVKSKNKKETSNLEKDTEEEPEKTYELEYSVKPRRVTVPRDNIKNILKKSKISKTDEVSENSEQSSANVIKSKDEQKKETLEKKVASGKLNDNFVRINIQKKVFARGKKTLTFGKYKKKMWRQKQKAKSLCGPNMDMGGCDGGQLTCFNCGQVGHFAQKCPAAKGEQLLPLSAVDQEDYCPFPTLEEASEMAKTDLAVRKPKNCTEISKEEQDESSATDFDTESAESDADSADDIFNDDFDDQLLAQTLKLEKVTKEINNEQFIDHTKVIKPFYDLKPDGSIIETPQEVLDVLQMFGHTSFRPGQEQAIMRILSGQSTLVTLSTGSGKSLCYQLPAYLYAQKEPCIALVISPLVSLMEDQVTGIPHFLKAECLHTNKTKIQKERIMKVISESNLHVLLVSPEAVVAGEKQTGFGSLLRKLPPIAFACIDEAHCVSQWSHNFRPSYLMICRILKERLGVHTILGLTATATRSTCDSIVGHLGVPDGPKGIISDIPLPDNLRLTVSKDANRDQSLLRLLLSERFEKLKSVIIYCTRRKECDRIASFLRTSLKDERPVESSSKKRKRQNHQAEPYHAGLPASKRRSIQNSFMCGDLRIVVATVAFGMGINKSDIRAVIHYNLPRNFESYVQEVGRAGRDGLPAHCHLFLDYQGRDENELQRHIFSDSMDRHVIRKLLEKIFIACSCKGKCPKHEVAFSIEQTVRALDIPEENIATLLCYLELHQERYIEVLSPAYTKCKITAYGSANHIRKAAKDCPPLAMALAMFASKEDETSNIFEFPVVEVAAAMGWDSGICKFKLKNLEWITENNQPKRSFLTVHFVDLGFRLLAPGNLNDDQLDEALINLYGRVVHQERCSLLQLHLLHKTVTDVAENSYRTCISDEISPKELNLKAAIRDYFDSPNPLEECSFTSKKCDEDVIASDCRALIGMYRDNNFTARAIARIFYGISSPNYPAVIWGRCRFWRAHLTSNFNEILKVATREILKTR